MSIMDNEGHDPQGFMNAPNRTEVSSMKSHGLPGSAGMNWTDDDKAEARARERATRRYRLGSVRFEHTRTVIAFLRWWLPRLIKGQR